MGVVMIAGFLLGSYAHALFYQVTMFLTLLLAPLGLMLYTRKQAGGYLNYGKTFQAGFIPIFLSVCILSVFYFLYLQYLNPLAFEYEKQKTAANLKAAGMQEDLIKNTLQNMKPIKTALNYFLSFWIVGTLSCLLYAALCYRSETS
ncbi:MAG: DUF4199 domain-containing protein [Bacteroidia bacterium]|nr:DUF4199 domain-containing protein [Bacteroidia bacterium]